MTEENETVHQIENEMRRMMNIIADDQEAILHRDKLIISLQNTLKEKDFCYGVGTRPPLYFVDKMHTTIH